MRRLQEFTRIRRDQPAVAVDLNQVVREALELTESSWRLEPPRRGIVIQAVTELAADLPTTLGDPAELREVMTNLILNAVDAMPRGGTLTLSTARRGESIELRVADTGVGIPEAVRGKIFDPFFTTKGPKGTGLGLSMTYGILSRHGATITVDSQEGQGTTFTLLFPVGAAPQAPAPDAGAAAARRGAALPRGRRRGGRGRHGGRRAPLGRAHGRRRAQRRRGALARAGVSRSTWSSPI